MNLFWITFHCFLVSISLAEEIDQKGEPTSQGYVAEWEFQEVELKKISTENVHPPSRLSPATWLSPDGSWWLFGGQRGHETLKVNQSEPEYLGDLWSYKGSKWTPIFQPVRETATPLSSYPENLRELNLCGSLTSGHLAVFGSSASTLTSLDPMFEDNTVWLHDIPRSNTSGEAPWTSYICCDACLPDQNTTLEFCPHFQSKGQFGDNRPLVWCSTESVMALNLNLTEGIHWWKFNLGVTEWMKISSQRSTKVNFTQLFNSSCKTVGDGDIAYVLCAAGPTTREIYTIDPEETAITWISKIELNLAFKEDPLLWSTGCDLAVVKVKSQTLLILAYRKLLDFWLYDHLTGEVQLLENLWKGQSLKNFQQTSGFYQLIVTFPSNETKILFLTNPREPMLNFDPWKAKTFWVQIQPDTTVFLPSRDLPPDDRVEETSLNDHQTNSPIFKLFNYSSKIEIFNKSVTVNITNSYDVKSLGKAQIGSINSKLSTDFAKIIDQNLFANSTDLRATTESYSYSNPILSTIPNFPVYQNPISINPSSTTTKLDLRELNVTTSTNKSRTTDPRFNVTAQPNWFRDQKTLSKLNTSSV